MKAKILIIALLAIVSIKSFSQDIEYVYDLAGNRTERHVIPPPPQAPAQEDVVSDNVDNKEIEPEVYEDLLAEKQIKIYPNPTRGKLAIEIVNYNLNDVGTIQVFDMVGRLVQNVTKLSNQLEVDITSEPSGSYIIIIVIGDEKSEWKVIKQ
ncbi:MAG: T9SS type A sorting domain-containing protein [Bacteroidales bacterium]|nr:T9SS type A sorting domain-containing protein [Bacteroidales bacterium]